MGSYKLVGDSGHILQPALNNTDLSKHGTVDPVLEQTTDIYPLVNIQKAIENGHRPSKQWIYPAIKW